MKDTNQVIRCKIESCKHNRPDHYCSLKSISVCPCEPCDCDNVKKKSESMCADFHEKESGFF